MKEITVLFTAACGWPTHATADALKKSTKAKFTIVGVDCSPRDEALNYVDYIYKVPRTTEPDYVPALLEICKKHKVQVIVPLISEDLMPLWDNIEILKENGISILMSGKDSMLPVANDKFLLQKFLEENDLFYMPRTKKMNRETLEEDLRELGYPEKPVAVKLKDACGAIGFKILDEERSKKKQDILSRSFRANPYTTKAEVLNFTKGVEDRYLLQEYVPGSECSTLCLVDHGETVYSVTHENTEMQYATATHCMLVDNKEANEIVRVVNKLLKLDGNIGFDFKRDADGKLRLLEINPRISATVGLAAKAGLNIVEMGVLHVLGYEIERDIVPLYGMTMQRVYGTLYSYKGEPYGRGL